MRTAILLTISLMASFAYAGNTNYQPQLSKIVKTLTMDLDGDYYVDTVYLAKPEKQAQEDLDLWIKLSTDNEYFKVEGVAYDLTDAMAGMGNELKINSSGSLQVYTYNDSTGRYRYEETLTFAFRNGAVTLAGYTHNYRDTIDLSYIKCDINLLTKKGKVQSDRGDATFEINASDVISAENASNMDLGETYLNKYCIGATSDLDQGDH